MFRQAPGPTPPPPTPPPQQPNHQHHTAHTDHPHIWPAPQRPNFHPRQTAPPPPQHHTPAPLLPITLKPATLWPASGFLTTSASLNQENQKSIDYSISMTQQGPSRRISTQFSLIQSSSVFHFAARAAAWRPWPRRHAPGAARSSSVRVSAFLSELQLAQVIRN